MRTARCPGCGASIRVGAAWCSLCYRDLRQPAPAVVLPRVGGADNLDHFHNADIADAEFTDAPAVPATGRARSHRPGEPPIVDAEIVEDHPHGSSAVTGSGSAATWPCSCGTQVPLSAPACPTCGNPFLADLAGAGHGRHRAGRSRHWPRSRGASLALAGLVAVVLAVGLPLLLALLG